MRISLTCVFFCLAISTTAFGQAAATTAAPPNPCDLPQQKQLDFWLGDWDLTWPGPKPGDTLHGSNHVVRILGQCVVQENFDGGGSPPFTGMSVSLYDLRSGRWRQTWVDSQGSYLELVGDFKDGQMVLSRETSKPDGSKIWQRMIYKNIAPAEFDWSWETSTDGKTWTVAWPIHYKRKT